MACNKCRDNEGTIKAIFACDCTDKSKANIPRSQWKTSGYPTNHRYDTETYHQMDMKRTEDYKPIDMSWFWGI